MTKDKPDILKYLEDVYTTSTMKYEIMFAEFALLNGFEFHIVKFDIGTKIARCRFNSDNNSYKNVTQISYPPNTYINDFSRANRPNQKLFYASDSEIACLAEMIPLWNRVLSGQEKYKVTSSLWKTTDMLNMIVIPNRNSTSDYNKIIIKKMKEIEQDFWEYITNKFKTTTLDDEYIYEFTSAFSNALRINAHNQGFKVDGIIYSNVLLDEYINIALLPEIIDSQKLIPFEIVELEFIKNNQGNNVSPNYTDTGIRRRGIINNNDIIWKT